MKKLLGVLLAITLLFILTACGQKSAATWQEQYDLGVRYLSEGNYQEAILAFTAAIEIDPKQSPAYVGLADAYTGAGDTDAARKALEDGLAACGNSPELQEKLDELAEQMAGSPPAVEAAADASSLGGEAVPATAKGSLELSNLTYTYESSGHMAELNQNAVGGMILDFTVEGPASVREVCVATWWEDSIPQDMLESGLQEYPEAWKQAGAMIYGNEEPPFRSNTSHPIFAEDIGKTFEVMLIGLDANGDAVGYALVTEQIPG